MIPGYRMTGVHAGLKAPGQPDLALIHSEGPSTAAAVFTQNLFQGAPVVYGRQVLATHRHNIQAVVINSRVANAATGPEGLADAEQMGRWTAQALHLEDSAGVMVMSTGTIGVRLPMDKIRAGIDRAAQFPPGDAARAIMTTDTRPKTATVKVGPATLWGMAKGAGMIHPNMATMLCVIPTDAHLDADALQLALEHANETSFNCITDGWRYQPERYVPGAGQRPSRPIETERFRQALTEVCQSLARQVAFDGEGASPSISRCCTLMAPPTRPTPAISDAPSPRPRW